MLASDEAGTLADELSYILQNVAKSISIQNANGNIPFRLSDQNGKIVFQDIHFAVQESLAYRCGPWAPDCGNRGPLLYTDRPALNAGRHCILH